MNRLKALYRGWGIPCVGTQVYAPRYRSEWLGKTPGEDAHLIASQGEANTNCTSMQGLDAPKIVLAPGSGRSVFRLTSPFIAHSDNAVIGTYACSEEKSSASTMKNRPPNARTSAVVESGQAPNDRVFSETGVKGRACHGLCALTGATPGIDFGESRLGRSCCDLRLDDFADQPTRSFGERKLVRKATLK
jgi:hypothetical protein